MGEFLLLCPRQTIVAAVVVCCFSPALPRQQGKTEKKNSSVSLSSPLLIETREQKLLSEEGYINNKKNDYGGQQVDGPGHGCASALLLCVGSPVCLPYVCVL